jgi:hypothetical protein
MHIDDDRLCQLLEASVMTKRATTGPKINFLNVHRSGPAALLDSFPDAFAEQDGRPPPHDRRRG